MAPAQPQTQESISERKDQMHNDTVILLIIIVAVLVAVQQYAMPEFIEVLQERLIQAAEAGK
jgi:hypothetical protein